MDTDRFQVWFDQIYPNFGFQDTTRNTVKDYAQRAWEAAQLSKAVPKPIDGNARMAGFGAPATVVSPPKRPILPVPENADSLKVKHWNIWDTTKFQFASKELTKDQAFYWAQRYNNKADRNIYIPIPVEHE